MRKENKVEVVGQQPQHLCWCCKHPDVYNLLKNMLCFIFEIMSNSNSSGALEIGGNGNILNSWCDVLGGEEEKECWIEYFDRKCLRCHEHTQFSDFGGELFES